MAEAYHKKTIILWLLPIIVTIAILSFALWEIKVQKTAISELLNKTEITHSNVVEKVEAVAKLVSSETTLRDVVLYKNTFYGSTKQSLVVVTGKVMAGIDLKNQTDVNIDQKSKKITIKIPQAKILAIEVVDMKTYDEQQGFWNPFQPSDRDLIFKQARDQFQHTAEEMNLIDHANESAKKMLETMFSVEGFQTEVIFKPMPVIKG